MHRLLLFAVTLFAASASGCAARSDFPSLARRSFEVGPATPTVAAPVPALPADAPLQSRIASALAAARGGVAGFETASARARTDVAAAQGSAAGSEAWIAAQLSLSRAEATLGPSSEALSDLDAEKRVLLTTSPASPDNSALDAAIAELSALSEAQSAALRVLAERLSR